MSSTSAAAPRIPDASSGTADVRIAPPDERNDLPRQLLEAQRELAERRLNGARAAILVLLATAALGYASQLPDSVNQLNLALLAVTLTWTFAQYARYSGGHALPSWLYLANPIVDITAVTFVLGGYGITHDAALAFKSPIILTYFVILAARPIASSTRTATVIAVLVVVEYAAVLAYFVATGRLDLVASPLAASTGAGISLLDEGAKLLFLAVAGAMATYATAWHERMALSYFEQARVRERLEGQLAQAQLQTLRLQLQPHFLFNTLNTIAALVSSDARAAERMVTRLSDLLRQTLNNAAEQEVTLARELELLSPYLEIQRLRFADRLRVDFNIAPDAENALVPSLLLQPLIENAIRHGITPRAAGGRVDVRARRDGEYLRIEVADDGIGFRAWSGRTPREGVGLGATRGRLRHMYGAAHHLTLDAPPEGGFTVRLAIPYREASRSTPTNTAV
ncbi:MAG TPA: histidine kinase [Gemmatimonadaceae bacterium]|nr:histidine kinase [Gemmatimonadaceae bacterium]